MLVVALLAALLTASAPVSPASALDDTVPPAGANPPRATQTVAGAAHTCALLADGTVKCWGANGAGQLGLGDTDARGDGPDEMGDALPTVDLGTGHTATQLTAGNTASCALLDDATVKCWGANWAGQLGLGDTDARGDQPDEMGDALPTLDLGTGHTATQLTAGLEHTCALLDDAAIKCWGYNGSGRLGLGDTDHRGDGPGEMGDALPAVELVSTGTLSGRVTDSATGAAVPGTWVAVLRTSDFSTAAGAVADANGSFRLDVTTGGYYLYLVDPAGAHTAGFHGSPTVVEVLPGGTAVANPTIDSTRGALAGTITDEPTGDPIPGGWAIAIDSTGLAAGSVADTNGDYTIDGIAPGTYRATFVDPAGTHQQEYHEDSPDYPGATAFAVTAATTSDIDGTLPTVPPGAADTAAVAPGTTHTCALLREGLVKCWGGNQYGQLGLGDTTARGDDPDEMGGNLSPADLGAGHRATQVAVGFAHTCALLEDALLTCWGNNGHGQLGEGTTAHRGDQPGEMGDALPTVDLGTGRSATQVVAGFGNHSCALLDDGEVKCWGDNILGQLGLGDNADRGDGPGEMGDALPAVDLGTGRTATQLAAGLQHTCALLDDGTVKCWGGNNVGQLGLGDTNSRGGQHGPMGDGLPAVDLGTGRTATQLTAGVFHTCALLDDTSTKCWGDNTYGQLGLGDTASRGDQPDEMGDDLPAIDLGSGRAADQITAGFQDTCALLGDGTAACWGHNEDGQLGLGDIESRGDEEGEMGDDLEAIDLGTQQVATRIAAGGYHTCALTNGPTPKCWGNNLAGQLGLGDTADRGDEPGEMGDALPAVELASTGTLSGTVTDATTAAAIPGGWVAVLRATDFSFAAGAVADANGDYTVQLPTGNYFLYLIDPSGAHTAGFGDGTPAPVEITADDTTTADPAMPTNRGGFSGTITDQATGDPVAGCWVLAIGPSGITGGVSTDANGQYTIDGLPTGTYVATFADPDGGRAQEFWDDGADYGAATPLTIGTGITTTGIDAALAVSP